MNMQYWINQKNKGYPEPRNDNLIVGSQRPITLRCFIKKL